MNVSTLAYKMTVLPVHLVLYHILQVLIRPRMLQITNKTMPGPISRLLSSDAVHNMVYVGHASLYAAMAVCNTACSALSIQSHFC